MLGIEKAHFVGAARGAAAGGRPGARGGAALAVSHPAEPHVAISAPAGELALPACVPQARRAGGHRELIIYKYHSQSQFINTPFA